MDVQPLKKGQERADIAVKVAENLIDVYIIEEKAFYHYNVKITSQSEYIDIFLCMIFDISQSSTV